MYSATFWHAWWGNGHYWRELPLLLERQRENLLAGPMYWSLWVIFQKCVRHVVVYSEYM